MKNLYFFIYLLLYVNSYSQQNIQYISRNNKHVNFTISNNEFLIITNDNINLSKNKILTIESKISKNIFIVKAKFKGNYNDVVKLIKKEFKNINNIEPILISNDGYKLACNNELIIKTSNISKVKANLLKNKYIFKIIHLKKNIYKLSFINLNTYKLFDVINNLQLMEEVFYIEPNFIREIKFSTSDPYYSLQWYINNQGYLGGIIDADADVDDAWNISTGQGIKIAIVDEGVELNHPDLSDNLLTGIDLATSDNETEGGCSGNDYHGTACAGIVAAVANNNKGIAGIAYNAKIIPIRIAYNYYGTWYTTNYTLSKGIEYAYKNGADIINLSWQTSDSGTDYITDEINNATTSGRNGKGCLVVVSSGNDNLNHVSFPASLPNTLAVGASNMFDERKSPSTAYHDECWYNDCHGGSNYGNALDLVAPGVKMYTTDITGNKGKNNTDYMSNFNGTSAAAPVVSGVAALVLSVNPNLNYHQLREILERTADKMPNYNFSNSPNHPSGTWNDKVGYGRINAYSAILDITTQIIGNLTTCYYSTFSVDGIPSTMQVNWVTSTNLQINSYPSNHSVTVSPINNNISESGFIEAHYNNVVKRKNIWVGKSKPSVTKIGSCYEPIYQITATYPDTALEFKIVYNGNTQYHSGSTYYEISPDYYNLQDGESTTVYVNIRNNCGWSPTYPVIITKPTLCDCGYDNPGCGGSSGPPTVLDAEISDEIFVFPNPSSDIVKINIGDSETKLIQVVNNAGKIINEINVDKYIIELDISNFANGLYFIKFFTKDGVKVEKLIIAH